MNWQKFKWANLEELAKSKNSIMRGQEQKHSRPFRPLRLRFLPLGNTLCGNPLVGSGKVERNA